MARKPREISASGIYHVMWRGIDRQSIFLDDADCIKFLSLCAAVLDEWFEILAFCLMGNHLHLLIKTKKDTAEEMEQAMKRLGIRYAQYFNRRYLRVGPVFQGRYKSVPVQTRNYFLRVLRYIHQNPVKANLCELPEEYLWSSYIDYFGQRDMVICPVNKSYALQLADLDFLKTFHTQKEPNPATMSDEPARLPDQTVMRLGASMAGCSLGAISTLPESKQAAILRRLVLEEGAFVPQLTRLTGIPRGVIARYIM